MATLCVGMHVDAFNRPLLPPARRTSLPSARPGDRLDQLAATVRPLAAWAVARSIAEGELIGG
jgi:hypothetical protein